jgi:hypothetical protein
MRPSSGCRTRSANNPGSTGDRHSQRVPFGVADSGASAAGIAEARAASPKVPHGRRAGGECSQLASAARREHLDDAPTASIAFTRDLYTHPNVDELDHADAWHYVAFATPHIDDYRSRSTRNECTVMHRNAAPAVNLTLSAASCEAMRAAKSRPSDPCPKQGGSWYST